MDNLYLGQMVLFAGLFLPKNCLVCDGSLLPVNQNQALFSLLGTSYGGDGINNFGIPDMRGKAPVSAGISKSATNYVVGQKGGSESQALNSSQIPSHFHTAQFNGTPPLSVSGVTVNAGADPAQAVNTPQGNYWGLVPDLGLQQVKSYTDTKNAVMANDVLSKAGLPAIPGKVTVSSTGAGVPHENRPPFLTISWIIAISGLYPQRN